MTLMEEARENSEASGTWSLQLGQISITLLTILRRQEKLVITPFEKNLDIWRQLWRVLERSDLIVLIVDSRNPLFYRSPDLEVCIFRFGTKEF
jgi:hypothetical protein